jgi:hypothetical protein
MLAAEDVADRARRARIASEVVVSSATPSNIVAWVLPI